MDVLENQTTDDELFSHAVFSVKILAEHVGVVSPGNGRYTNFTFLMSQCVRQPIDKPKLRWRVIAKLIERLAQVDDEVSSYGNNCTYQP